MNPANNLNLANQAYQQGTANQQALNQQSQLLQNQYQASRGGAEQAQGNLQQFAQNAPNYGQLYGQDLASAQKMYGFDPTQLLKANMALATTNTTLANLPKAIQQQGNYYGTTAGQEAGNYANQASNLQGVLAGQSNTVNAYQNLLGATQQQAQQQTTQQLAGQQQKLAALQAAATNATNIMQNSGQVMQQIEGLAQQQGYLTAQQTAAYQNAYSQYISAQAAKTQAGAAAQLAGAQSAQIQQQVNYMNQITGAMQKLYGPNYQVALAELAKGTPITVPTVNNQQGISLGGAGGGLQGGTGLQ